MGKGNVLVLDCGTQSVRSVIFDKKGKLLGIEQVKYPKYETNGDGFVEMNADIFWDSFVKSVKQFWENKPEVMKNVVAITIASQRSVSVFVDKDGKPLKNAISWMDQRKTKNNVNIGNMQKRLYKLAKVWDMLDGYNRKCPYHWVQENEPEIYKKVHKLLFLSTYLNFKLTGLFRDCITSAPGYIPFSNKRLDWANSKDIEGKIFSVKKEHLFELVQPGEKIGDLTNESAKLLNLPAGIPVIASGADKACETIGIGCFDESTVSVSLASMVTVQTTTDTFMPLYKYGTVYPAAIEGKYNPELGITRGFWLISWFVDEFAELEKKESKDKNVSIEKVLNEKLNLVPPGSDGLLMQTFWMSDPRHPAATGTLIGLNDVHTRIHMYRALVEGLGYSIKEGILAIEKKTKVKIKKVGLSGGGSKSIILSQLIADILNKEVYVVQTHETTGLGASMIGYIHLGEYNDVKEAAEHMVQETKTYYPNKEIAKKYETLYKEIYKLTYQRLQPVYDKMMDLRN
ncbi:L-fuculokinase [Candidatus Izimaplasma bacterium HR1]|uniref:FGGY-family carbohydrate kinase n=1 Tax=Candidatus Izimoplasma sp. HR1 TaxID=1541959 RepID=UPI0004F5D816|nr:L-fuculokinase [Candidatus Izimaplasma bacterium HR1]